MNRAQTSIIIKDLTKKMVFLAGPRQTGKTWLAKHIADQQPHSLYLNYDQPEDRRMILAQSWLPSTELVVFDELHKMPNWKDYLKGLYDTKPGHLKALVTGSARLDIFHTVGDSLAGRYYLHHLFPLSLAELKQVEKTPDLERLIKRSGFPEPYLEKNNIEAERWRRQYTRSLTQEDVLDFQNIQDLRALQLTLELLRERVGSPISITSLATDVQVSPNTIKKYLYILEALYIIFRVTPYSKNIARSILKEAKFYFFDNGLVKGDDGIKLENTVAIALLKSTYGRIDYLAQECRVQYLRTKEGKEVDFVMVQDQKIEQAIEVKLSDTTISKPLIYFCKKYDFEGIQLVKNMANSFVSKHQDIKVIKVKEYLENLFL